VPNRIIKESICTSDDIEKLTSFEETLFYRLIVTCDDYGRADARLKVLKSRIFPLKDVTHKCVDDALQALAIAGLVVRYEVAGKPFLFLPAWLKHQNPRAKESKYPEPPLTK
jgi:hypothetical protein